MIVLNDIVRDNRVLKTAKAMQSICGDFTLLGTYRPVGLADYRRRKVTIDGLRCILFPNHLKTLATMRFFKNVPRADRQRFVLASLETRIRAHVQHAGTPDLLHTHDMYCLRIGRALKRDAIERGEEMFWIHDVHELVSGLDQIDPGLRDLALADEISMLNEADHVLTVTEELAARLLEQYPDLDRNSCTVIFNSPRWIGASPRDRQETLRSVLQLPSSTPLAVYTGQVKERRGVDVLIEALTLLDRVHLAILTNNTGRYMDNLKRRAAMAGVDSRVFFHPYVPPESVPYFISDADVGLFALEPYGNAEVALANKLFDYLFAGLPVAVSGRVAQGTFVSRLGVGTVFDEQDLHSTVESIAAVLRDSQRYRKAIEAAGSELRTYAWDVQEERLKRVYLGGMGLERAPSMGA